MDSVYQFVVGPLAWAAWTVFLGGSLIRLALMYRSVRKKDPVVFEYMSFKYGMRSILHWIIPFGTVSWRKNPAMTVVTFGFHILLFVAPIFLLGHVVLWDQYVGITLPALPEWLADMFALGVVLACLFFGARRIMLPEVSFVTRPMDWLVLGIVLMPFLTGILAYHQIFAYEYMLILHIVSGEIMLAAIPFTRLSHMLFGFISRAYMGSEFGAVRHVKDW